MDFGSLVKIYSDASTSASNLGVDLNLSPLLDKMTRQIDVSDCLEAVISAVETIVEVDSIDFSKIEDTIPPPLNSTLDISDIITNDSTITNGADSINVTNDANVAESEAGSDSESDEETTDSNRPKKPRARTEATKKHYSGSSPTSSRKQAKTVLPIIKMVRGTCWERWYSNEN